jgi:hypothetical protein
MNGGKGEERLRQLWRRKRWMRRSVFQCFESLEEKMLEKTLKALVLMRSSGEQK